MPRSQSLNDRATDLALNLDPKSLNPREASALADQLTNDAGIQERVLAGDRSLERLIGDLAARGAGVDWHESGTDMDTSLRRAFRDAEWAEQDEQRQEREQAARLKEADAVVEAHTKRVSTLTRLGFDHDVAWRVAERGDAEVNRVAKLDPGLYQRGHEVERVENIGD